MPDEKKEDGKWGKVVVPIVVALLAGGTTPWWWGKLIGGNQPSPTPSQTVNPSSSANSPNSKTLQVYADSTKGTPFLNKENGYVNVDFEATGKWLAIPENISDSKITDNVKGYLSPAGDPNFNSNTTACVRAPLGALVVIGEDKQCKAYGAKGSFELKAGETVYFKMNDVPKLYEDNRGTIDIKLSISKG